jgi:hypothetical protein
MPVLYEVDSSNWIVRTTFSGLVSQRDRLDHLRALRADPTFDPSFSELINFDTCSVLNLSFTDFLMLSKIDPFSKESKRAIVVGTRPVIYGVARMYQQTTDNDPRVRIFATMDDAEQWIKDPAWFEQQGL